MKELIFLCQKKDYFNIEVLNEFCVNMVCYENKIVYPVYLSNQKFHDNMNLLLISNKFVSLGVH